MYIVTQLVSKKEKAEMEQTFKALDKNADGKLSQDELIEGYTQLYGDRDRALREVELVMSNVDIDRSKFIDYSGNPSTHSQSSLSPPLIRRSCFRRRT
jgi:calcium-dependent protein kinase